MSNRAAIRFEHVIIDADGPANPHVKAAGDVNGDGFVDVVVASSAGGPLVWYEYPDWRRHVIAPSGGWSTDVALADMNGDGELDVVVSDWYGHGRLEWYENPLPHGDPAKDPWKLHVIGTPRAHDIKVADVDGDGHPEIVTRQQGGDGGEIVLWKRRRADEWAKRVIECPTGEGLALGDLASSGRLDVVIGGRWYEAPPDVLREAWAEHTFAEWPPDAVVRVADLAGSGRADVILMRSEGLHRLSWFQVPSDPRCGDWLEHVVDDSVDFAHSLQVGDVASSGRLDIVTAEMHQSARKRVLVYLNEGAGESWRRQVLAETGSHNLCLGDVGATGVLDLIGANWSGDYQPVEMWRQLR